MSVLQLLAQGNFITFNKTVAKELGVNSAILLGALCGYQASFGEGNEFFKEQPKICEDTCLGIYELKQATKILKDNGLIKVSRKKCPAKNYYLVSANKLGDFLLTSQVETYQLDSGFSANYITNNTNTNNTSINKKEEKKVIKEKYGEFGRVLLTDKEYDKLLKDFGETKLKEQIRLVDEYVESNNNKNKYTNFNLVIRKSIRDNWFSKVQTKKAEQPKEQTTMLGLYL